VTNASSDPDHEQPQIPIPALGHTPQILKPTTSRQTSPGEKAMFSSNAVPIIVVLTAAIVAAVTDIWKFKVYNALTLPLLAAGLLYHGLRLEITDSLMGILFGFAALVPLYIIGGMGAGDVKLMAAIGAWLGLQLTFYVFIASSLAAGIYAIMLMVATGKVGETIVNLHILWLRLASIGRYLASDDRVEAEVKRTDRRRRIIPFAAMVAIGIIATLVWFRSDVLR
jgi:prepilin peptidase CpaA